jgi:hypothetical protein
MKEDCTGIICKVWQVCHHPELCQKECFDKDLVEKRVKMREITCVDATDFPDEVLDYCDQHDISTHYQNDVIVVEDDGNPFAKWLKDQGYEFKNSDFGDYIAILAT